MAKKQAIITGITGQDGRVLSEFLLSQGYSVTGVSRRTSTQTPDPERLQIVNGDINDPQFLNELLEQVKPDELYNLAAQSFVENSWKQPTNTVESTAVAVLHCLEAIRKFSPGTRFFQAASSEIFGATEVTPQDESSPMHPRSPYATSKLFGYWSVRNYRDRYGLFASNGIMYNHESIHRGLEFVTRKVTHAAARIKLGLADHLSLGSLDAQRDWGWAPDYVEAMWRMLQHDQPDDFVIATGKLHSVRDLVRIAFGAVGLDWARYVQVDEKLVRKAETVPLCGNASKARRVLGWEPRVPFEKVVELMVQNDLRDLTEE